MFWPFPPPGTADYWFNNLSYDVTNMEYFNIGQNAPQTAGQGQLVVFNNTFQNNVLSGGGIFGCTSSYPFTWTAANNHYITQGSSAYNSTQCTTGGNGDTTSLLMNNSTATSDGYMSSQAYAYSPTSSSSPTVGAGTNEGTINGAYCTALSNAGLSAAAASCQSGTTYACSYNSTSHTMSCPGQAAVARPPSGGWGIGAYQYSTGVLGSNPAPPTSLTAAAQ